MRLIDGEALIKTLNEEKIKFNADVNYFIINAPTIDAEPVRHGHWIFEPKDAIEMMFTRPKCSECGYESADGLYYCSCCGARMEITDETY